MSVDEKAAGSDKFHTVSFKSFFISTYYPIVNMAVGISKEKSNFRKRELVYKDAAFVSQFYLSHCDYVIVVVIAFIVGFIVFVAFMVLYFQQPQFYHFI